MLNPENRLRQKKPQYVGYCITSLNLWVQLTGTTQYMDACYL